MGSAHSSAFSYEDQLVHDTANYSLEVPLSTSSSSDSSSSSSPSSSSSSSSSPAAAAVSAGLPRRHPKSQEGLVAIPYVNEKDVNPEGGYRTLYEAFQRGINKSGEQPCLGTRVYLAADSSGVVNRGEYVWQTYPEVDVIAREVGAALVSFGCKVGEENVGLFSANRAEWIQTALGVYTQNMRVVALYDTLGAEAVEYIANHAELRVIFTTAEKIPQLLKVLHKIKGLTHIIQFDTLPLYNNTSEALKPEHVDEAAKLNIQLLGFQQVRALGRQNEKVFPTLPKSSDLCMVMYTSGTTGNPKGVMLTHGNVCASVACVPEFWQLEASDRHMSFLPLAHIFEFTVEFALLLNGARIGYFQNNIRQLTNDWIALLPTILVGVPRVFNRMYTTVMNKVTSEQCIKKWYFNKAYAAQCAALREKKPRDASYDKLVFSKIRATIGLAHLKGIITGAAPCPPYLQEFLKVVIGCPVLQGYGMTESSAAITISSSNDACLGHCGAPVSSMEVQLRDVPDMNYFSNSPDGIPRGEVCARGPGVFVGYYKDPKATAETLDSDGWLMTGDIGRWNKNGTLSIIDRKKNMFKLSNGEYVAAEKVETEYGKAPFVGQIWVYGNSFKSFLLAVVVPNAETLFKFCVEKGWWPHPEAKLASDEFITDFHSVLTGEHAAEVKAAVMASMKEHEKALKPFERVTDIIIEPSINNMLSGFTEGNNCLTPTFKLRRPQLLQRYIVQLKKTYADSGEPVGADEKWPGEV